MRNKGFTLIELMMVLIIIGILAGLITAASFRAIEDAKIGQAQSEIAAFETALAMYESDVGDFPLMTPAGNNQFKFWLDDGDGSTGWDGPYMNFTSGDVSGNAATDPWGNIYQYQCPGVEHDSTTNPFDIYTTDSDGNSINNWD